MMSTLSSFSGQFRVYDGTTEVTIGHGVAFSIVEEVGCDAEIDATTGVYTLASLTSDNAYAVLKAIYKGTDIIKTFRANKSRAGVDGSAAKLIDVTTTHQTFVYDSAGVIQNQTTTIKAARQNSSSQTEWRILKGDGTALVSWGTAAQLVSQGAANASSDNDTLTVNQAQFDALVQANGGNAFIWQARLSDATAVSDQISIVRVRDGRTGAPAINAFLTNDNVSVESDENGSVVSFSGAGGQFRVTVGEDNATPVTFSVVGATGVAIAINATSGIYSVTGMSANSGTATLRALYKGLHLDRVYTITKIGSIQTIQRIDADLDAAKALAASELASAKSELNADIAAANTAITNARADLTADLSSLDAEVSATQSSIATARTDLAADIQAARDAAAADVDLVEVRATNLEVATGNLTSRISTEELVRSDADNALAVRATNLEARSIGGGNLLTNTTLQTMAGWTPLDGLDVGPSNYQFVINLAGPLYYPQNEFVLGMRQVGHKGTHGYLLYKSEPVLVQAGSYIQWSVLANAHRANVGAVVYYLDSAGTFVGYSEVGPTATPGNFGSDISHYAKIGHKSVLVPAGAAAAYLELRKFDTFVGEGDSYAWFWRPYMGVAREGQTEWNAFSHGSGRAVTVETTARLATEESARATADSSITNRLSSAESEYRFNNSARVDDINVVTSRIENEETTRSNADAAITVRLTNAESEYRGANSSTNARIALEEATRADADSALANRSTNLEAKLVRTGKHPVVAADSFVVSSSGDPLTLASAGNYGFTSNYGPFIEFAGNGANADAAISRNVVPVSRRGGVVYKLRTRLWETTNNPTKVSFYASYLDHHFNEISVAIIGPWHDITNTAFNHVEREWVAPFVEGSVWLRFAVLFNRDPINPGGLYVPGAVTRIFELTADDITTVYNAEASLNARIATEESARASADSAIANRTSIIEAGVASSPTWINQNSNFALWSDAEALPNWWSWWVQGGSTLRGQNTNAGGGWFFRHDINAGIDSGIYQSNSAIHNGWYVLEADAELLSGSWQGAGLTLEGIYNLDFATTPDNNGLISAGVNSRRRWSKLIKVDHPNVMNNFHLMTSWTGFGQPLASKYLKWFNGGIRPATDGEIQAQKAAADLVIANARIATEESTRATADSALAVRSDTIEARARIGGSTYGENFNSVDEVTHCWQNTHPDGSAAFVMPPNALVGGAWDNRVCLIVGPEVGNQYAFSRKKYPVDPTKRYRLDWFVGAYLNGSTGFGPATYVGVVCLNGAGEFIDHGSLGSYRYAALQGQRLPDGVPNTGSVIMTGESNTASWQHFAPGTKYVRLMFIMNERSDSTCNTYIDYIRFSEAEGEGKALDANARITSEVATLVAADGALATRTGSLEAKVGVHNSGEIVARLAAEESARASADSAIVSRANTLEASVGRSNFLNRNPMFQERWDAAIGTSPAYPPGWSQWGWNGAGEYHGKQGNGNAANYSQEVAPRLDRNAHAPSGMYQSVGGGREYAAGWYVLEAEVTFSGNNNISPGSGLHFANNHISFNLDFYGDPDISGSKFDYRTDGKTYRFTKMVNCTQTFTAFSIYAMSEWSGFGYGYHGNASLIWHKCGVRPATEQEIQARQATIELTTVNARITNEENARATADSALATRASTLESRVGGHNSGEIVARLENEENTRASADGALATRATNLESTVGNHGARLTTAEGTLATAAGRTAAWWGVELDAGGRARIKAFADNYGSAVDIGADVITLGNQKTFEVVDGRATVAGDLYVEGGCVIIRGATHQQVTGTGFGVGGEMIEWYGPIMPLANCSRTNGVSWKNRNGAMKIAAFQIGVLVSGNTTANTGANASVSVITGSNGGLIQANASWYWKHTYTFIYASNQLADFNAARNQLGMTDQGGSYAFNGPVAMPSQAITLRRNGVGVASNTTTEMIRDAYGIAPNSSAGEQGSIVVTDVISLGVSYTDPEQNTVNRTYEAVLTRNGLNLLTEQRVSVGTSE